jgi:hypothetical protein
MENAVRTRYGTRRLVSTRSEWEWEGAVHEYVRRADGVHVGQAVQNTLMGVSMVHDANGGKSGSRYQRDAAILEQAVLEQPSNARSRFYLGNTYRALGLDDEAIEQYMIRIQLGHWVEEQFVSALNIAHILKKRYGAHSQLHPQPFFVPGLLCFLPTTPATPQPHVPSLEPTRSLA